MALTKLTTDLIDGTIVTSVNGSTGAVTLETGTDWQATPKTADFTAVAGEGYFVDTTSTAITVTLPSSPSSGDEVNLVDYAGTADTNNITITSSDNINGASDDVLINYERGGVSMVYVNATQGWIAYNAANETAHALVPPSISVDYLVVAGGGGSSLGGGGAGGYKSGSFDASGNNPYTVTIGAGGAGTTIIGGGGSQSFGAEYRGVNGVNTTVTGSGLTTISATGGGGGGNLTKNFDRSTGPADPSKYGSDGGSGGGGATHDLRQGLGGSGIVGQGNDGGNGSPDSGGGGGGGGASSAGVTSTTANAGGNGGNGLTTTITGTSTSFCGGGGGKGRGSGDGTGGTGGGGAADSPGTANTGGGAGGNVQQGGSGVVILRYPNTYTVTIGSGLTGSTATDGSDKVTTLTAGIGNIQFN